MIYHCIDCDFITHLKSNYTRHMTSKKHFLMSDTQETKEDLEKRELVKQNNKKSIDKIRTPEYIKKANKKRRDKYENDELHRLQKKISSNKYISENKEKVAKAKKKYAITNRDKINTYSREYNKKDWWRNKLNSAKVEDKKYNRYVKEEYIKKKNIFDLQETQNNKCIYCNCEMTNNKKGEPTTLTIERKDNDLGHNTSNCVLCCFSCNVKRRASYTFEEFKLLNI
jgi:hypothetical protein